MAVGAQELEGEHGLVTSEEREVPGSVRVNETEYFIMQYFRNSKFTQKSLMNKCQNCK